MKLTMKIPSAETVLGFVKRYKTVILILAAGILLLIFSGGEDKEGLQEAGGVVGAEEDFSVESLELKLCEILSGIEGAGRVSVMLTVRSGTERIIAMDREYSEGENTGELSEKAVIISTDDGEEVVLVGQNYPVFQGAVIVCPGGDDPKIKLILTQALSGLTGLSSSRITVCKGS